MTMEQGYGAAEQALPRSGLGKAHAIGQKIDCPGPSSPVPETFPATVPATFPVTFPDGPADVPDRPETGAFHDRPCTVIAT